MTNSAPANAPLTDKGDLAEAIALLTRLPLRSEFRRGAAAAWAWPLAGALVGAIAGGIGLAAGGWLHLPAGIAAGLVLAAQVVLTGAMHEDGLADSADGLWGGFDPARRLEIMRDSRIGSYGVLALGLGLILRWSALTALAASGGLLAATIAAAALSRAPMAVIAAALPHARSDGLSKGVGRPDQATATLAVVLAAAVALVLTGWTGLAAAGLWASLATIAVAVLARAKIGGQTGDILGASQQLAEIAALAAFASLA